MAFMIIIIHYLKQEWWNYGCPKSFCMKQGVKTINFYPHGIEK